MKAADTQEPRLLVLQFPFFIKDSHSNLAGKWGQAKAQRHHQGQQMNCLSTCKFTGLWYTLSMIDNPLPVVADMLLV